MKNFTCIFFVVILTNIGNFCFSQNYQWAKSIGSQYSDVSYSLAIDDTSNVYITGKFFETADFDPGLGTAYLTSAGSSDIFFAKYNSTGDYFWAKNIGGLNSDNSYSIAVANSGNIYITGGFSYTADFDPSIYSANLTAVSNYDIFFAKYNNNGDYIWAKSIGNNGNDNSFSVVVDSIENVYIIGTFIGTVDFDPSSSGTAYLNAGSTYSVFFAKYDSMGNYIWAKNIVSPNCCDEAESITIDNSGNIYIAGEFYGTTDFDPSLTGTTYLTPVGSGDIFFAKYDNNGNYIWAKSIGNPIDDNCKNIKVDSSGYVYITGCFRSIVDFDPDTSTANLTSVGYYDIFFAKYDDNGSYVWAKNIGSVLDDMGNCIDIDNLGNVYITGRFQNIADFNPSLSGSTNLTSMGQNDIYFAKYDHNGNFMFAKSIGSINHEDSYSLSVDGYENIYITGSFQDIADFDPGIGTANLTSVGSDDIFFAKYSKVETTVDMLNEKTECFKIYPNPAKDKIIISNNSEVFKINKISILNIYGNKIVDYNFQNQNSIEIDIKMLTKGIYMVKIQTDYIMDTRKLVIQ